MKRAVLPIGLSLVAAAVFMLWPKTAIMPPVTSSEQPVQPASIAQTPETSVAQPANANGNLMVGRFRLSLNNDLLLPTPTVLALFNEWLGTTQPQRYEEWKPRALAEAANLPPAAREQLEKWLDQYVELNLAMQLMAVKGEPTWDNILANVRSARRTYFSDAETPLFSEQIALEDFTENVVTAFADDSNPLATLVDLEQQADALPAAMRPRVDAMLNQFSTALQQNPALNADAQAWNRLVQANAAATLEAPSVDLTEANADFLKRYNAYAAERDALIGQGATEEQLRALRETHFSGTERLRAGTFDKALAE